MEKYKKGVNAYQNFEVNEFGTIARNLTTGEVVQVTTTARYNTFNFKSTTINAHTLVAHAWLADSYQDGLEVDHLVSKDDNHYSNLEWVTHSENCKRAAARRKSKRVGGKMTYSMFLDVLETRRVQKLSHSQMVQYVGNTYGEWFDISYFPNIYNKVSCKKHWERKGN